ncbi:hypothetical protein [Dictyobacter arantiisoli]|uniref:Uncharacterized protein n=1 Tax=Dictyobacter arantiisoli TaxID=2014874 RepID=A0A5A5TCS5_9CHLR|nr:hypothetical protein [Dictyobacter arantiisoli]GCF09252.1 hypothetical protein KDI_28160 [Dictyobacter arantiisoli]
MAVLSVASLAGIIFLGICAVVLGAFGIRSIRSGRKALARARIVGSGAVWHKQISILFGLNNLVFAGLVILVMLLMLLTVHIIKMVLIALIILLLVVSVVLVVRCLMSALQASQQPVAPRRDHKEEDV